MASPGRRIAVGISLLLSGALLVWAGTAFLRKASQTGEDRSSPAAEPRTADAWYARGNELLRNARDFRGAAEAYRQAAELAPEMGEAHYGRGYALLELGDMDGAIPELESALSLAPENAGWRKDAENALVLANLKNSRRKKP